MKIIKTSFLCVLVLLAVTSCREDLCYDHFRNTAVSLSYEQVWERDYGMNHAQSWDTVANGKYQSYCPSLPETVSMHAYSQESGESSLYFLDRQGGVAGLRSGKCDILLPWTSRVRRRYAISAPFTMSRRRCTSLQRKAKTSAVSFWPMGGCRSWAIQSTKR